MSFIVFAVVGAIVGALIGYRAGRAADGAILGILLGPVGWLITLFLKDLRFKCPFCAEIVQPMAKKCPHCLEALQPHLEKPYCWWKPITVAVVAVAFFGGLLLWFYIIIMH